MPRIKVDAPAKLNLHLQIGDRRPDGFHYIESLFTALAFGDTLSFETFHTPQIMEICMDWQPPEVLSGGVRSGDFPVGKVAIPPEKNIISRAVSLFRSHTDYEKGLKISVEKRIPPGGGLGGGSSDAAAALLALNHLASPDGKGLLSDTVLAEMGASLGSDVPFFIHAIPRYEKEENLTTEEHGVLIRKPSFPPCNSVYSVVKNSSFLHSAAWISGRGEIVRPIELPESARNLSIVLVNPGFLSDTAEAYRLFDVWRMKNTLLPPQNLEFLPQSLAGSPQNWPFFNDFLTVFRNAAGEYPAMSGIITTYQHIISDLKEQGAVFAGLSGSGSTCFGVFSEREKAESARESLAAHWPFVVSTFLLARQTI
jgi:4-diphosphocytidyl-2-C-methyl-D-erythritol kinase